MMRFLTLLFLVFALNANAQQSKTALYIQQYGDLAVAEMLRSGVPAAITLAQGILESQSGESDLVKRSNNHFGIKCKTEWTGDKTYHDDDERGECFRVYPNAEASYKDHSEFLRTRPHYNFLFRLNPADYTAWANGLKKAGYATLPAYPQKLIKLIKDYQLDRFNTQAIAIQSTGTKSTLVNSLTDPAIQRVIQAKVSDLLPQEQLAEQASAKPVNTTVVLAEEPDNAELAETAEAAPKKQPEIKVTSGYPEGVFTINQTKVILATEGTSLLALANQYDITLSRLMDFNEISNTEILEASQLIFLEKKQKKGATDFHIVKEGENLYTIAQLEGVRLENLLQFNNFSKIITPVTGNKIYLKAITSTAQTKTNK